MEILKEIEGSPPISLLVLIESRHPPTRIGNYCLPSELSPVEMLPEGLNIL